MTVFGDIAGTSWPLIAETVINGLWLGAALTASMWLVLRAVPWLNATTRYAIWCVTLLAVVSLPFLAGRAAPATAAAASFASPVRAASVEEPAAGGGSTGEGGQGRAAAAAVAAALRPAALQIPVRVAITIFALWLLVAIVLSARLLGGYLRLRRLKREAVPLGAEHQARLRHWLAICGIRRAVRVASARSIQMPLAAGLLDAVILVPEDLLARLTGEEFDQVLLHELAHIRRGDDWTFFLQKTVEAFFFFHPGILLIGRKLDLEREVACDDWVITLTGRRRRYATCLTRLIELKVLSRSQSPAPGVLDGRRDASRRVELLLDKKRNARPQLCKVGGIVVLAMLGGMFSQFARLSPAFTIKPAGDTSVNEIRADAFTGQDIIGEFVAADSSGVFTDEHMHDAPQSIAGQASAPASATPANASPASAPPARIKDGVVSVVEVESMSHAPRRDGRMSAADEHDKHQYEMRVKALMEPRLREIQRDASQAVRPEANELARLAHGLTYEKVHALEMRGETPSAGQMRRIQSEVDAALKDKMDAIERKVSAIADPLTRAAEREARQKAAQETGAERM